VLQTAVLVVCALEQTTEVAVLPTDNVSPVPVFLDRVLDFQLETAVPVAHNVPLPSVPEMSVQVLLMEALVLAAPNVYQVTVLLEHVLRQDYQMEAAAL
jgi:hypothetical protein